MGVFVLVREKRLLANSAFVMGVLVVGVESILWGLSANSTLPADMVEWAKLAMVATSALSPIWLFFTTIYSRGDAQEQIWKWGWLIGISAGVMVAISVIWADSTVLRADLNPASGDWIVVLGRPGMTIQFYFLANAVMAILNLERTFRAAVGTIKWRIKFMVIGVGMLLAARIYLCSEIIVSGSLNLSLSTVLDGVAIISMMLIFRSFQRSSLKPMDVYPSQAVLKNSLTLLFAGIYLLVVGMLAKVVTWLGNERAVPLKTLVVVVLLVVMASLLMSNRLQQRLRNWISQNFQRPQFDYRKVWMSFTRLTASCGNRTEVCRSTTRWISETFNALSVTIFLLEDSGRHFIFGASTSMNESEAAERLSTVRGLELLATQIQFVNEPVNIDSTDVAWAQVVRNLHSATFEAGGNRICIPLAAGGCTVGLVIVGDRVNAEEFTLEEFDLLKCVSDQVAGNLLSFELSERLLRSREMEAFQTMSTFFVHDLKNTASTLSIMLQNLPVYFDDPEFRRDALRTIGKTVERINELITRLGMLRQKTALITVPADLNELIRTTVAPLQKAHSLAVEFKPGEDIPRVDVDQEQLQKVITNLVLNAKDAIGAEGRILIETSTIPGWVQFSVQDNGCGMSPEFLRNSLFKPFQSTKKKGIGIGMYHSRVIIEAHRGKIEVESEQGKGSTFRVILPMKGDNL